MANHNKCKKTQWTNENSKQIHVTDAKRGKTRATDQVAIGFGSNWLAIFFKPITERSKAKPKQFRITCDTQLKTALIGQNNVLINSVKVCKPICWTTSEGFLQEGFLQDFFEKLVWRVSLFSPYTTPWPSPPMGGDGWHFRLSRSQKEEKLKLFLPLEYVLVNSVMVLRHTETAQYYQGSC